MRTGRRELRFAIAWCASGLRSVLAIQDHQRWSDAAGDHLRHVIDALQTQGLDARFAQFGADGAAQIPFARNDKDGRHLRGRIQHLA